MTETSYPYAVPPDGSHPRRRADHRRYRGFNGHCAFDQTQVVASIRSW